MGIRPRQKDLRGDVEWGAFDRLEKVSRCTHLLGESEVADLDDIFLQEYVLRFEVTMQDAILMEIKHGIEYLFSIESDPIFWEFTHLFK